MLGAGRYTWNRPMRRLIALILISLSLAGAAQAFDSPKALLEAIYAPYQAGGRQNAPEQFYSARLRGLIAENLRRHTADAAGPLDNAAPDVLDFDPFIEGQHSLLLDLKLGEPVVQGERATSIVSFHNFDHSSLLTIAMVREAGGWLVDDIASLGSGENWLLSWLLQYDPFGQM